MLLELWLTPRRTALRGLLAAAALVAGSDALAQCGPAAWLPADKPTGIGENGNSAIVCTEWDPDGAGPLPSRLVVAGAFYFAGGRLANSIAYWDGSDWHAMGDGLRDFSLPSVVALHVHNGELYAAGSFLFSDSTFLHNIARWDGAAWVALGDGTDSTVFSLTSFNGDLIVGGSFSSAGGIAAERIARWDGAQWHAMGDGFDDSVSALAVYNGSLYAGGGMTGSGPTTIEAIGRWTGSAWVGVGGGLHSASSARVEALCVYNSGLIAAGRFTSAGLTSVNNVARWNGATWQSTGAALNLPPTSLALVGSDLIVGSVWHSVVGNQVVQTTPNVNRWNGTAWSPLPVVNGSPRTVISFRGQIAAVGGIFTDADNERAGGVLVYDGTEWQAVGQQGLAHNTVQQMGEFQGDVIIAARQDRLQRETGFDFGLTVPLLRWRNGAIVDTIGVVDVYSGMTPSVQDILQVGSDLFICGLFDTVNGVDALNVARWNGTTWSPVGNGITPRGVGSYVLAEYNGQIIAGGQFVEAEGSPGNSITRWDGTAWQRLGDGLQAITPTFTGAGEVYVLLPYEGKLLALGYFTHAGGVPANSAALWDGTTWTAFPGDLAGTLVTGAGFYNGDLVVSGLFFNNQANGALRWDGSTWQSLGAGLGGNNGDSGYARTIVQTGNDLYFGGYFTTAGGAPARNIASWNGTSWSTLGDGLERVIYDNGPGAEVNALIAHNGELLIGGTFNKAGGQGAANFARYCLATVPTTGACCIGTACSVTTQAACTGAFQSLGTACGTVANPTTCCPVNFDGANGLQVADIFAFLTAWFNGDPQADFDHANGIQVQDIFAFLNAWFQGC